jgi:hypothetical protein
MRAFQVLLVLTLTIVEVRCFLCSSQNSCLRSFAKHEPRHSARCRMSTDNTGEQQAAATSSLDRTNAGSAALASRRSWLRNATAAIAATLFAAVATQAEAAELSLTNRIAEMQASEAMAGWVEPEITSRAFMRLSIDGVPAGMFTISAVDIRIGC